MSKKLNVLQIVMWGRSETDGEGKIFVSEKE